MQFAQKSFGGGLNTLASDTQIEVDEFTWLVNGRNRYGYISPINKHLTIASPAGLNYQGCFGLGNVLIIFIDGKAYYTVTGTTINFQQITGFSLDPYVDEIYSEAVPNSYLNFQRKVPTVSSEQQINATIILNNTLISGTPACVVNQDGKSRPMLIFWDSINNTFYARAGKNFSDWQNSSTTADDREYVPVGRNMMYFDGVLYMVAPDRKSVYRSVTGRPLDFMINVDESGNKAATEAEGGATTTSFAFDYDDITCLSPTTIPGSFIYATANNVRVITTDYNNTIFGEPTFIVSSIINAGIVNHKSLVDVLGDYAFIDKEAVISFDAVRQLRFNGRNSIFSLEISKFLKDIKQGSNTIAFTFDNFALFNIDTNVGNIIAVYDIIKQKWTGFDITDIRSIKQVAYTETETASYVFAVTWQNELYQLYGDTTDVYTTQLYTRSHVEDDTNAEHKSTFFRTLFNNVYDNGSAIVTELVDNRLSKVIIQPITGTSAGVHYPVRPPVMPSNKIATENPSYALKDGLTGKKIKFVVQWDTPAQLVEYTFLSVPKTGLTSQKQSDNIMKATYGS